MYSFLLLLIQIILKMIEYYQPFKRCKINGVDVLVNQDTYATYSAPVFFYHDV